ncbi:MAG: DUF2281 domain-containing protein [Planktothrix sp.]|uniref:DUF2281 domain-containing protein n=3 Tax=Planktothrix sp. TaxID=3088171 RepID=UPI0038D49E59
MPSLDVREFAEKINQLSLEDQQWLLQQLIQKINISNDSDLNPSNSLTNEFKKTFNITPAVKRKFGSAKGLISMLPDFDEPLEDFKDYM